jgi:putative transcriptional regulator
MKLENRLKVLRAQMDVTQQEFADTVGVSRQTVNAIERGRFVPSTLTALRMAAYFRVNVEEIFRIEEGE